MKGEYKPRCCRECRVTFRPKRSDQVFCESNCRIRWHSRAQVRMGQLYQAAIEWRVTRGSAKGKLGEMAHMIDQWVGEDRKAGRWIPGVQDTPSATTPETPPSTT